MTVTSTNLIQGPATLYWAAFGATEPATVATVPDDEVWTDLGGTDGGVDFEVADEYSELTVDQLVYVAERRRTLRRVRAKTALAEATLENLARATNNSAPTSHVMEGDDGLTAFAPAYGAILLDGIAPGGFRRRIILRKTLSIETMSTSYKKDGKTMIPATWEIHWVSPSIKPFKIEDATS